MFKTTLNYELNPIAKTLTVSVPKKTIIRLTAETLFWSMAPVVAFAAVITLVEKRRSDDPFDSIPRDTE